MQQALLVRLRPCGPWRYGPSDGAGDRVDTLYRSDRLFSALTLAMRQMGLLDSWLDATARSQKPVVAFSSLFPFQGDTLYVTPPANLWPPPASLVNSPSPVFLTKVRWRAAHFVPMSLVDSLMSGQSVLADQWIPDPESGCLLRRDRPSSSPFRTVARAFAPVDRLNLTSSEAAPQACVEFETGSGLWTVVRFWDETAFETWKAPLQSAFRLLGDSGFGGGRSRGWGQVQAPEFETGNWPAVILPKVARAARNEGADEPTSRSYWLLSLYSPAAHDSVNWSGGQYELVVRNGRVDGASGASKKSVRMVEEGCVLDSAAEPVGAAIDVAPTGFAHPVYCSGIALSLLIPPPKPVGDDRRAIEEIVPPELEATPFPMPVLDREPDTGMNPQPVPPEVAPEPLHEDVPELAPDPPEPAPHHVPEVTDEPPPEKPAEEPAQPAPEVLPAMSPEPVPQFTPEVSPEPSPEPHPKISPAHVPEVTHEPPSEKPAEEPAQAVPEAVPAVSPKPVPQFSPEVSPEPAQDPHPEISLAHLPEATHEPPAQQPVQEALGIKPVIEVVPEDHSTVNAPGSQEDKGHEV